MKKEIEINELIESFLKGTLPEKDLERVSHLMQEDASFARQVELQRQLHSVISDSVYVGMKNELKHVHLKRMQISRRIRRITGFGSAGLIVGLAVLFLVTRNTKTDDILSESPVQTMEQPSASPLSDELSPAGDTSPADAGIDTRAMGEVPAAWERTVSVSGSAEHTGQQATDQELPEAGVTGQENAATGTENDIPPQVISGFEATPNQPMTSDRENADNGPATEDQGGPALQAMANDTASLAETKDEGTVASETSRRVDCSNVVIEAGFTTDVSCNNAPTGHIVIDRQSLRGGNPPYSFSLNGKAYSDTAMFSALFPGNYPIYARDADGCISRLGNAVVGLEDCTYEYAFAPMRGGEWTVPVREDGTGILIIYSKEGNMVYNVSVNGNETTIWRGETVSGQGLPMGLYQFEIRYDDGTRFIGNVTLVR